MNQNKSRNEWIKTQLIIGVLIFAEFQDHISIDYGLMFELLHNNRAYAGLRHGIVIATKPHFRVTSYVVNKARLGCDNNSVT